MIAVIANSDVGIVVNCSESKMDTSGIIVNVAIFKWVDIMNLESHNITSRSSAF